MLVTIFFPRRGPCSRARALHLTAGVVLLAAFAAGGPVLAAASRAGGAAPTRAEIAAAVARLEADPDLGGERRMRALRWKDAGAPAQREEPWIRGLLEYLGRTGRALVWAAAALCAAGAAVRVRRTLRPRPPPAGGSAAARRPRELDAMNRTLVIRSLVLAGSIMLVAYVVAHTRWDSVAVRAPMRGEAARDPYYAVERLAQSLGIDARAIDSLRDLPPDAVVLVDSLRDDPQREPLQDLQAWVQSGGRLIIGRDTLQGSEALEVWSGIRPLPAAPAAAGTLLSERIPEWSLSDGDALEALRVAIGRGELTVLGPTSMLDNWGLPLRDHAAILVQAAALKRGDSLLILGPIRPEPLPLWLWRLDAPAIVFLASALALLILRALPRFGPAPPARPQGPRSLAEQIRTTARFCLRMRKLGGLRAAIRRALEETAQRQIPGYRAFPPRRRADALAARTGIDPFAIEAALSLEGSGSVNEQRAAITLLEACRRVLVGAHPSHGQSS